MESLGAPLKEVCAWVEQCFPLPANSHNTFFPCNKAIALLILVSSCWKHLSNDFISILF